MSTLLWCLLLVFPVNGEWSSEIPSVLRAAYDSRLGLVSGSVRLAMFNASGRRTGEYTFCFNHDDALIEASHPIPSWGPGTRPQASVAMRLDGQHWYTDRGSIFARTSSMKPQRWHDCRGLGLLPTCYLLEEYPGAFQAAVAGADNVPYARFRTQREGGLFLVTGRCENGSEHPAYVKWWIDPKRSWNVVRTERGHGDTCMGRTKVTLAQVGGVWFPRRVELFGVDTAGQSFLSARVEVRQARFNDPAVEPVSLTMAGIDTGIVVNFIKDAHGHADPQRYSVVGTELLPIDEIRARAARGDLEYGSTHKLNYKTVVRENRIAAHLRKRGIDTDPPKPESFKLSWVEYVREFTRVYALAPAQARAAERVLTECVVDADSYLNERRKLLDELQQRRRRLVQSDRPVEEVVDEWVAWQQEVNSALDRLRVTFADRLQPGLYDLLEAGQADGVADQALIGRWGGENIKERCHANSAGA